MADEGGKVGAVGGSQPGADNDGRAGDHGIYAQTALSACDIEKPGGGVGLRFVKNNNLLEKSPHGGNR